MYPEFLNTWPCLTLLSVSMACSSDLHIWTSLDRSLFLLEDWATYLSHMCVWDRNPNEIHIGTQKCCACSCIPGSRLAGWQKREWLSRLKRYTRNYLMDTLLLLFYSLLKGLEHLLLCLFFMSCCSNPYFLTEGSSKPLKKQKKK